MKKRLMDIYLFIISSPGLIMSKKRNALWHLKYVCPKCPKWRKGMRYVHGQKCFWNYNWKKDKFEIPRTWVGNFRNLIRVISLKRPDFTKFKEKYPKDLY
jgi:hypothetical protein